jgi:hypothetical protein
MNEKVIAAMRVTSDLHSEILKSAEEDVRSVQDQVRWLIKLGLEARKKDKEVLDRTKGRNYVRRTKVPKS